MSQKPEAERIAIVETMISNLEKRVDAGFAEVKTELRALGVKVGSLHDGYATKADLEEVKKIATSRLWQATVLTAILTALIVYLITK